MTFTSPTTEDQMYSVLQDIFYYYRIRRDPDSGVSLEPLDLTRETFTPSTNQALRSKAQTAVAPAQALRLLNYKATLEDEIAELTAKIAVYEQQKTAKIAAARSDFAEASSKAQADAIKKGIAQSNVVVDRIAELNLELAARIDAIEDEIDEKIAVATARRTALNAKLTAANTYYSDVNEYEILAKIEDLKDAEAKIVREVFKYNNSLSEREQRSSNTLLSTMRELELRYLDITSKTFSKDELVEMGYYDDVIKCVCDYYDTLSDVAAYHGIVNNRKVAIYLDDYYSNIVYMYKTRANL